MENVTYRYPGSRTDALSEVSFQVGRNGFVGVVGPNGGGKTTLIKLLLGLLEPDRGEIRVLGGRPEDVRTRIGYVPQHAAVDPTVPATVLDIVLMGRLSHSSWGPRFPQEDMEAARGALAQTGTEDLWQRPWLSLSGGQRQRVLIARALAAEAELLLLDEPTRGVDLHREQELLLLLDRLKKELPVMMVSHDLALVTSHMDVAIWVNRQVFSTPARELTVEVVEGLFHGHSDREAGA
jgi:zinc transport system ATP-binding protein